MFTLYACPPASQLASASNNPAVILDPFLPCSATQKPSLNRKWSRCSVRAKVAVDEGGRTRLQLTDCPPAEKTNGIEISGRCPPRLEFAGRIDHGDCSIVKPAVRTQTSARVIVIAGPTAVGKTRVALALAKQVYEGLNVGSAKTPVHERGVSNQSQHGMFMCSVGFFLIYRILVCCNTWSF
jgi:hypothetical protein